MHKKQGKDIFFPLSANKTEINGRFGRAPPHLFVS